MQSKRVLGICLGVSLLLLAVSLYAQTVRPTHGGTVWELSFIHVKPGMGSAYDKYLASDWKKEQEALKAAGMILSYKVIGTEAHSPNDWDLMLMVEFKDLATLEANEDKADALMQKMFGGDEKVMQGYKERSDIREVLGTRLAREIILEPKK
ncbi:MAG TPA: hypothetical protein VED66_11205 [Candidatus Sulfotelmatobacter sp.]|nr:hypothetical protein [Candidatus Sulfotelmatobacter sp.]